jgi:hypothetical protein
MNKLLLLALGTFAIGTEGNAIAGIGFVGAACELFALGLLLYTLRVRSTSRTAAAPLASLSTATHSS